jgi:hypothetical protein
MQTTAQDLKNSTSVMCRAIADHIEKALPTSNASADAYNMIMFAADKCDKAIDFAFGESNPQTSADQASAPAAVDSMPAPGAAETLSDSELDQLKNSDPGAYAAAFEKKTSGAI